MGLAASTLWVNARRLMMALVLSGALTVAATSSLYVTAEPKWISLLLEPLSLLLFPGVAIAMATAGRDDFSPDAVVEASAVFYLVCVYVWLLWRSRRTRPAGQRRTGTLL